MPLPLNSYLKFILEILRSSTSSFKTPGCWESKIVSFSHFNSAFNKVFVQRVPDFSGNTVRLSNKIQWWLHISGRCPQDFSQLPPVPGSSSIPITSVFLSLKRIPSEKSNFCLCIILAKAALTGVILANTPDISQQPLEPGSCTKLRGDSQPSCAPSRRWPAGWEAEAPAPWSFSVWFGEMGARCCPYPQRTFLLGVSLADYHQPGFKMRWRLQAALPKAFVHTAGAKV